ncbi:MULTISPECIES: ATP-binding protein [unclassified Pseudomonas]|uniref:ATP-binding protein n=1 Tax=unclassified Pseudomonas TaxID=196821 RepID=UPI000BC480D8|nr:MULTISPECIES: ATP-binding protein [unclassified Pseudomonas]PVZ19946.1 DNA replication protein DnaC [Pseudomonas sp. URIL14HWK12:I12]PVZ27012.1 DNA replication protein DnaC [Pseudomonas sp. URIL14HWK12:I10]PVZ37901.1 DNA replication protein DnaC [Pseudomonas sp. URIL14HWK12:I11]SNZ05214.1 DNA replication protein DnaC [Pseudomonas sp. URIL14HWK12:I9]
MRSEKVIAMGDVKAAAGYRIQPATCETHGDFEQRVTMMFGKEFSGACPQCAAAEKAKGEAREQAAKARGEREAMERKLGEALIPKRFADKTLASYRATTKPQAFAHQACIRYVAAFDEIERTGRCLLLLGKPGTGKTHLGAGIANELMHTTSKTAVYRTFGSVLQAIRSSYGQGAEQTEVDILRSLISPDLLVLDELGVSKEQPSDFEMTTLFAIINGRYEQMRPTVVISNLGASDLPKAIGDRCMDRLRENGGFVVPFEWESQRGKEGV